MYTKYLVLFVKEFILKEATLLQLEHAFLKDYLHSIPTVENKP